MKLTPAPVEMNSNACFTLQRVGFSYGEKSILQSLDWSLIQGGFESIIGRSGCGKSTLLQLLCGLLLPTRGELFFKGNALTKPRIEISYVFQKPNLLEWLSVIDNVLMPMKIRGEVTSSVKKQAMEILDLLGISAHAYRPTWQLSGGEQSRVSIARALVASPQVLLMDEPFAALDAITREELQGELRHLHDQLGLTTVFVTHDIQEAIYLADRVHVLEQGHFVHSQDIEFMTLRQPGLKDEVQFANYSNLLRNSLACVAPNSKGSSSAQGVVHV